MANLPEKIAKSTLLLALALLTTAPLAANASCEMNIDAPEQPCTFAFFIRNGNLYGVKRSLAKGADVNLKDDYGTPLLHLALLLPRSTTDLHPALPQKDKVFDSLVPNKIAVSHYLIQNGADVNADYKGMTALHIAAQDPRLASVMDALLDKGANIDRAGGNHAVTPLLSAIEAKNSDAIVKLIHRGANVNKAMEKGITPLLAAIYKNNEEAVSYLIKAGADVERANDGGLRPLEIAVLEEKIGVIRMLLAAGADPDYRNPEHTDSPRKLAQNKSSEIRELFLKYPAKAAN